MIAIRKPYFWNRMSWTECAAYLVRTHQARDFPHACSILASLPRRKRTPPTTPREVRLPYRDD